MSNRIALGDVCEIIAGQSPPSKYYNSEGIGLPFFQGKADFGEVFPNIRVWCSQPYKVAEPGDILMSVRAPVGPTNLANVKCCIGRGLAAIRPGSNSDTKYLLHYLRHIEPQLAQSGRGSTFSAITVKELRNLEIPLPPLSEQQRIAAVLDAADGLRAKRRAALAKLDELLQAVFLEMFGDPVNIQFPIMGLNDVCELITDGAHLTPTYVDEGVPFLRVTDIQAATIDWSKTKKIPLEEHVNLIKRCRPAKGDVLYSKNGTIGIPRLVDWEEEFSIFVSLALLRPRQDLVLGGYLESFLKTPYALRQATNHTKTGTVSNLHLVEIRKIKLPVPSLPEQQEWLQAKARIEKKIELLNCSQRSIDGLFSSLQQRAFRGEL